MSTWAMLTAKKGGEWKVEGGVMGEDRLSFFFDGATTKQILRMIDPKKTRFILCLCRVRLGVTVKLAEDGSIIWPPPSVPVSGTTP
jgi:hypothetical protein